MRDSHQCPQSLELSVSEPAPAGRATGFTVPACSSSWDRPARGTHVRLWVFAGRDLRHSSHPFLKRKDRNGRIPMSFASGSFVVFVVFAFQGFWPRGYAVVHNLRILEPWATHSVNCVQRPAQGGTAPGSRRDFAPNFVRVGLNVRRDQRYNRGGSNGHTWSKQ